MRRVGPSVRLLVAVSLAASVAGCQGLPKDSFLSRIPTPGEFFHNLQPHRLSHLNRTSAPGRGDAYFSVSDPIEPAGNEDGRWSPVDGR